MGYWWLNWTGEEKFALMCWVCIDSMAEGVVDWTVVRVVVRDSWLCCGDEKVLFAPRHSVDDTAPPAVLDVPAWDVPSECIVSGFVARVNAAERLLRSGALAPLAASS